MLTAGLLLVLAVLLAAGDGPARVHRGGAYALREKADAAAARAATAIASRLSGQRSERGAVEICGALAAELRAGAAPQAALIAATADEARLVARGRAAALLGEDVAGALADDAASALRAGSAEAGALSGIAACWRVSADSGAGLADGLDRVAQLAAEGRRVADDLAAEVAAPRATARILAMLPFLGLLLGEMLGARPVQWLVSTPIGVGCLVLGSAFLTVGWFWSRRIVAAAAPGNAEVRR
jgi:tight adherence protein B